MTGVQTCALPICPVFPEDPMEAEDDEDDVVIVIDIPEDPLVIDILSDDEDEEIDAEPVRDSMSR